MNFADKLLKPLCSQQTLSSRLCFVVTGADSDLTDSATSEIRAQILKLFTGSVLSGLAYRLLSPYQGKSIQEIQSSAGPKLWTWCTLILTADKIKSEAISIPLDIALATSHDLVPLLWDVYFKASCISLHPFSYSCCEGLVSQQSTLQSIPFVERSSDTKTSYTHVWLPAALSAFQDHYFSHKIWV